MQNKQVKLIGYINYTGDSCFTFLMPVVEDEHGEKFKIQVNEHNFTIADLVPPPPKSIINKIESPQETPYVLEGQAPYMFIFNNEVFVGDRFKIIEHLGRIIVNESLNPSQLYDIFTFLRLPQLAIKAIKEKIKKYSKINLSIRNYHIPHALIIDKDVFLKIEELYSRILSFSSYKINLNDIQPLANELNEHDYMIGKYILSGGIEQLCLHQATSEIEEFRSNFINERKKHIAIFSRLSDLPMEFQYKPFLKKIVPYDDSERRPFLESVSENPFEVRKMEYELWDY